MARILDAGGDIIGIKEDNEESCKFCGTRKRVGFLCMECGRV